MTREEIIGCIAELRNGERGFIIPIHGTKSLVVAGKRLMRDIKFDYNGDAKLESFRSADGFTSTPQHDIVKIHKLASLNIYNNKEALGTSIEDYLEGSPYTTTIYKEKTVKEEMTLAEIEEALGHKVKIIS